MTDDELAAMTLRGRRTNKPINASHSLLADADRCRRIPFFKKVLEVEDPTTPAQQLGIDVHVVLESYMQGEPEPTGLLDRAYPIAERGKVLLPTPNPDIYHAERRILTPMRLNNGAIMPFKGAVDLHWWLDALGQPVPATEALASGDATLVIVDYKTRSSRDWAPDENGLATDAQMARYAYSLANAMPEPPAKVLVQHVNLLTRGVDAWTVGPVNVTWDDLNRIWAGTVERATQLYVDLSTANGPEDLPVGPVKSCNAFRTQCAYWHMCDANPDRRAGHAPSAAQTEALSMSQDALREALAARKAAKQTTAAPAPAPTEPTPVPTPPKPPTPPPAQAALNAPTPPTISEAQAYVAELREDGDEAAALIDMYLANSGMPKEDWAWAKGTPAMGLGWDKATVLGWDAATRRNVETNGLRPGADLAGVAQPANLDNQTRKFTAEEQAEAGRILLGAAEAILDAPKAGDKEAAEALLAEIDATNGGHIPADRVTKVLKEAYGVQRLRTPRIQAGVDAAMALRPGLNLLLNSNNSVTVQAKPGEPEGLRGPPMAQSEVVLKDEPDTEPLAVVTAQVAARPEDARQVAAAFEATAEAARQTALLARVREMDGYTKPLPPTDAPVTIQVTMPRIVYVGCMPTRGSARPAVADQFIAACIEAFEAKNGGVYWASVGEFWSTIRTIQSGLRNEIVANGWPEEWTQGVYLPADPGPGLHKECYAYIESTADVVIRGVR